MHETKPAGATRREILQLGARALVVLPIAAACGSGSETAGETPAPEPVTPPAPPKPPSPPPAAEPPAAEPPAASAGGGEGQLVTEVAASAALVSALQYRNASSNPDQRCGNCQLFTAREGDLGKCQLFPEGLVKESGWCTSWAAKVS